MLDGIFIFKGSEKPRRKLHTPIRGFYIEPRLVYARWCFLSYRVEQLKQSSIHLFVDFISSPDWSMLGKLFLFKESEKGLKELHRDLFRKGLTSPEK